MRTRPVACKYLCSLARYRCYEFGPNLRQKRDIFPRDKINANSNKSQNTEFPNSICGIFNKTFKNNQFYYILMHLLWMQISLIYFCELILTFSSTFHLISYFILF